MDFAFKSIVIHGLVKNNSGTDVPIKIEGGTLCVPLRIQQPSRGTPRHVPIYTDRASTLRASPPNPPRFEDIDLHLVLGQRHTTDHWHDDYMTYGDDIDEEIRQQKFHEVYTVSVDLSRTSPMASQIDLPREMVIKIAGQTSGASLAKEAAAYNYLQCLQGIVIPRCYGYFRQTVNLQEYIVMPWDSQCKTKFPRRREDLDIFNMPNSCASLNILLLEYVGENQSKGHVTQSYEELK